MALPSCSGSSGRALAWLAAALLATTATAQGAYQWHKPWATHAGCAALVHRFDFNMNFSEQVYRRFTACLARRKDLPDWEGSGRPALLSGEHYPVSVVPSTRSPPLYWITPAWDYVVSNFVRRDGTYEPAELQLFKSLVREGDVVCDIGSHVGSYAVPLAFHVGITGRVHAYEPFRLVFQVLTANVAINGLANVYTNNHGIGQEAEVRRVRSPALTRVSNIGATSIYTQAEPVFGEGNVLQYDGEENIRIVSFDSLELDEVSFMKIDVEGALSRVLRGAQQTIARFRPIIACEHEHHEPPTLLKEWDYRCVLVLPIHDLWICVPQEKWWRHKWLGAATDGRSPPHPPSAVGDDESSQPPPQVQSRRGGEPPKLVVPSGETF
eukprot:TRINITY_DN86550_c0_g1_i1.p1 TRINITY_DN86550_c0_g1~~TRINITY_DN86550_c0_g1_i1.p1  ORF type:complete len:381 (-),score=70.25 TRINITY_DN86550_c0_g1_i1:8-1150(-)